MQWAEEAKASPPSAIPSAIAHSLLVRVVGWCFGPHVGQQSSGPDERVCFSPAVCDFIHEWLLKLNSECSSQFHTTTDWDRVWSGVEGTKTKNKLSLIMNGGKKRECGRKLPWSPIGLHFCCTCNFSLNNMYLYFAKEKHAFKVSWSNTIRLADK